MRSFGWLVLGSTVCDVAATGLAAARTSAFSSEPAIAALISTLLGMIVGNAVLWWLIAVRASNVARWLYVVLTGFSVVAIPNTYEQTLRYGSFFGALMIGCYLLGFLSAALLFRRDAARWLGSRGHLGEVDLGVFD